MKGIKVTLAVMASALLLSAPAMAFHSGGVAECEGCHTMHNSLDGAQMTTGTALGAAGPYLLQGSDQSSACLNCHAAASPGSYHIASLTGAEQVNNNTEIPWQYTPGGDFGWLKKTFTWTPRAGESETWEGTTLGHSIVSADYSFDSDHTKAGGVAPRGAYASGAGYPVASLACSSCHDPHGRYRRTVDATDGVYLTTGAPIYSSGSYGATAGVTPSGNVFAVGAYRILGGNGYLPKSLSASATLAFTVDPPSAIAPSTYNQSETAGQIRVAYGKGMSEWCSNCHKGMHAAGAFASGVGTVHPAGNGAVLTGGAPFSIASNYNAYKKSGDMTGVVASAYNTLVPIETGEATATLLQKRAGFTKWDGTLASGVGTPKSANGVALVAGDITRGADAGAQVMCLSCHKAHASAFPSMLRYQVENEFTLNADPTGAAMFPGSDNVGAKASSVMARTNATWKAAYNGRDAINVGAPYQRALCNKCHAKD
jgi:hypothetical protein